MNNPVPHRTHKRLNTRQQMSEKEIIATKKICEMLDIDWEDTLMIDLSIKVWHKTENANG